MRNCFAISLTMSVLCLGGCGEDPNVTALRNYKRAPDSDISADPHYNFSSFAGTVWRTKDRTALGTIKRYTGEQVTYALSPTAFDASRPDYRPFDGGDMQIVAVLPAGVLLRVEQLMRDNGIAGLISVRVTVEDGANTHTNLFLDKHLLAHGRTPANRVISTNWGMKPEFLEEVKR